MSSSLAQRCASSTLSLSGSVMDAVGGGVTVSGITGLLKGNKRARQRNGNRIICETATSSGAWRPSKKPKSAAMAMSVNPQKQRKAPATAAIFAAAGASLRRLSKNASAPCRAVDSKAMP